jgi:bifunctional dethiobiotin synthetase / adenosylmethionine---8-amino-7-oxononanoate aminotransferase
MQRRSCHQYGRIERQQIHTYSKMIQVGVPSTRVRVSGTGDLLRRCFTTSYGPTDRPAPLSILSNKRFNLIFGANTGVGKTIVSAGLVRANVLNHCQTEYIKPLQCGGSDQAFVDRHVVSNPQIFRAQTLFRWETAASPHAASVLENKPCSDEQVLASLRKTLVDISRRDDGGTVTYMETAGGVLSPSAASPANKMLKHAQTKAENEESGWGWVTQGDLYQPLIGYAPVVLVGDGRLGGISCTLSALESLILRGYDVAAVILIEDPEHNNIHALREYASRAFKLRSGSGEVLFPIPARSMLSLPPIPQDPAVPLHDWYDSKPVRDTFSQLNIFLQNIWVGQVMDLQSTLSAGERSKTSVWWPGGKYGERQLVDSASGDHLHVIRSSSSELEQVPSIDGTASQWTHGIGHGESTLALAVGAAAGRYGYVAQGMHAPVIALGDRIIRGAGVWAENGRVLFCDDRGSVAVEHAIRLGICTYQSRKDLSSEEIEKTKWIVSCQEDCYHGDTLGALNVAEPYSDFEHPWYEQKGFAMDTPTIAYRNGTLSISFPEGMDPTDDIINEFESIEKVMDIRARSFTKLLSLYKEYVEMQWLVHEHRTQEKIGSVILEPVLQYAHRMKFVDPLWQRAVVEVAQSRDIPVIFDESTVGMYRLGVKNCHELLGVNPDIAVYSKLLTGGLLPMSIVVANSEVYDSNQYDADVNEFCQLPVMKNSYVAPATACNAALQSLAAFDICFESRDTGVGSRGALFFDESRVRALSRNSFVIEAFTLGTVLVVRVDFIRYARGDGKVSSLEFPLSDEEFAYSALMELVESLRDEGLDAGLTGDALFVMVSPLAKPEFCNCIVDKVVQQLGQV